MSRLVDEIPIPGTEPAKRRSGGREARRALRAAPPDRTQSPVKPGMASDHYRPLSQNDMERIHEAALTVLEDVGMGQPIESCIAACTGVGAVLGEDGRLRFPRQLVAQTVREAGRNITLCGRDPSHDIELSGNKVHFGTAGCGRSYRRCGKA